MFQESLENSAIVLKTVSLRINIRIGIDRYRYLLNENLKGVENIKIRKVKMGKKFSVLNTKAFHCLREGNASIKYSRYVR